MRNARKWIVACRWAVAAGLALAPFAAAAAPAPSSGGAPTIPQTAEESYQAAINAYNAGRYAEAAAGFAKIEQDFGQSEQGRAMVATLRYPLAMSFLHLQKFDPALEAIQACLGATPPPTAEQREDLMFYRGVCEMQAEAYVEARKSFDAFVREFPRSKQTGEAKLLYGTSWLLEEKYAEAAKQFAGVRPQLAPVDRGRATVLLLYALLQENKNDDALALVLEEFPRVGEIPQIAAFQTLALQLGATFLEAGEYRRAIQCLQRVWSQERITRHQEKRLADLEAGLAAAEAQPKGDPYLKFRYKQVIAKVRRELETLAKIPNFDSALRLRLASAYQAMRRYREAALVMEDMLAELPADPIVESASVNLVQCWSAIERWPRAIEAAQAFAKKFPASKQLPLVQYLAGIAQQRMNDQVAAIATFEDLRKRFPESEFAARAFFMRGFSQLLGEQNPAAIATFEEFPKAYPKSAKSDLAEAAAYWRGMGYSLDRQYSAARAAMDDYLRQYPDGAHRGLAVYRKAYAAQSMPDYETSIREVNAYLRQFPGHESNGEALLLLGDAYFAQGEIDPGIAAYERIPPAEKRFFEEGWFKIGKAYAKMDDPDRLRAHFERFVAEHPRSPRVAEAVFFIGKTHLQQEQPERAREVYWKALEELGDDPTIRSVDDLVPALARLYDGPEAQREYATRLSVLRDKADRENRPTLAMRALWAYALALRKSDPATSRKLLLAAAVRADVANTNPLLLADFAEALQADGQTAAAEKMWRDLLRWNPRAPRKDLALQSIAEIELARGDETAALAILGRFQREVTGSILAGKVHLTRAGLLEKRQRNAEAIVAYEALLADKTARGPDKAQALFRIAEIHLAEGKPALAVPYYQRIYVMHRRWRDWVAKAYLRSGEAFERLDDPTAARRTYQEMLGDDEYADLPETRAARARLDALGGPLPAAEPTPTPAQG